MLRPIHIFLLILIVLQFVFSASLLHKNDVFFHTDIARDFLLMDEMVKTGKPTLIGPKSGGIPGVFHGPLWLYINLPVFILTQGNPVAVGWFWWGLCALATVIFYFIAKIFVPKIPALTGTLLYATIIPPYANNLINPFGAVLLAPLILYYWYRYHKDAKIIDLMKLLLAIGFSIQFQMAFAGPILLLLIVYLLYRYRLAVPLTHLLTFSILFIPLSTFVLFDARHDFIQLRSLIAFIQQPPDSRFNLLMFIQKRLIGFLNSGWAITSYNAGYFLLPLILYGLKKGKGKLLPLFLYLYFGYWIVTLFFKGDVWNYYTQPFQALTILALLTLFPVVNRWFFYGFMGLLITLNTITSGHHAQSMMTFDQTDASSWKFNYTVVEKTLGDESGSAGYFVYAPDQFAYTQKYTLIYWQKLHPERQLFPFTKKPNTYVFMTADDPQNGYTNRDYWRTKRLGFTRAPDARAVFAHDFVVENFQLTEAETQIPIDPTIITDMHFR